MYGGHLDIPCAGLEDGFRGTVGRVDCMWFRSMWSKRIERKKRLFGRRLFVSYVEDGRFLIDVIDGRITIWQ